MAFRIKNTKPKKKVKEQESVSEEDKKVDKKKVVVKFNHSVKLSSNGIDDYQ